MMMRTSKNRTHLRWLIPLLISLVILVFMLLDYKRDIHEKSVEAKETEIIHVVEDEMTDIEISLARATSCLNASANAMSQYALSYNYNQIMNIMKNIIATTDVKDVFVCDAEGNGYNDDGRDVYVGNEPYFEEILAEYSNGGIGMILPDDYGEDGNPITYLVSYVSFEKNSKGFIVATMPVLALSDTVFMDRFMADRVAVITPDGTILASTRNFMSETGESEGGNSFWKLLPEGIAKDTVKLNLSKKNHYTAKIDGYGYIIVLPMRTATGGAVVLIREDQMDMMTAKNESSLWEFAMKIALLTVAYLIMVLLAHIVSDYVENRIREKRLSLKDTDPETGLLTKSSSEEEIQSYITSQGNTGGLLFLIGIEGISPETNIDKTIISARRKDFAKTLLSNFRASDILARVGKDKYLVFLKGVHDDKDVRKQMDEMQMFLHDMLVDTSDNAFAHAGAALCPENGRNVTELMDAAEKALERSMESGTGKLSF